MKTSIKIELLRTKLAKLEEIVHTHENLDQELVKKVAHLCEVIRQKKEILALLDFAQSLCYEQEV